MKSISNKRILFIGGASFATYSFRASLFKDLVSRHYDVFVICSDSETRKEIEELGTTFFEVPFNNRSLNPFSFSKIVKSFRSIIKKVNPNLVFTYQLKGNLFGSKAACLEQKPFICLNEGLGDGFGNKRTLIGRFIRRSSIILHRRHLKHAFKVFVINPDDKEFFLQNRLCTEEQIELINGVGVDCEKFQLCELPDNFSVINVSRLVKTKGVIDYCEIARRVRKKDSSITFKLVGPDGDLSENDIKPYIDSKDIVYLGFANDVRPCIKESSVIVLPSYREGFGISLVEGAAMGRPGIAYDVVGPKYFIIDDKTGYLIPFKDYDSFVEKILLLKSDRKKLEWMGKEARDNVINKCDSKSINKTIIFNIEKCLIK